MGLGAQPCHSVNISKFSSGAQKAFALPAVKLADREPLKSLNTLSSLKTAALTLKKLTGFSINLGHRTDKNSVFKAAAAKTKFSLLDCCHCFKYYKNYKFFKAIKQKQ